MTLKPLGSESLGTLEKLHMDSPDLPAGVENLQSTDAWGLPLPIQPESLVAGPRNR